MSSCLTLSKSENGNNDYLENLLKSARPFLRSEFEQVDENLPALLAVLRSNGAGECWHKDTNFLNHLVNIYRILKLWKVQDTVCLCGLYHSAYPTSEGSLTIYEPTVGRDTVRRLLGDPAEKLIYLYCGIPRGKIIRDELLSQYSDMELIEHLKLSELSLEKATQSIVEEDEAWRKKLQSLLPSTGITVKHVITGEDVHVSRRVVATFLMMTLADFGDQYFSFQDAIFENSDGKLKYSGNDYEATWPGDCKPGLWVSLISRIGALYTLVMREEEIFMLEKEKKNINNINSAIDIERDEDIMLITPPLFENCSKILNPEDQVKAREMYWEAVCFNNSGAKSEKGEELLLKCIKLNPFVGEPHVVLGQIYSSKGRFTEAEEEAEKGLKLLLEWGTAWDKRICWEGWISWARVLLFKAKDKSWPNTSWGILKLGLV